MLRDIHLFQCIADILFIAIPFDVGLPVDQRRIIYFPCPFIFPGSGIHPGGYRLKIRRAMESFTQNTNWRVSSLVISVSSI